MGNTVRQALFAALLVWSSSAIQHSQMLTSDEGTQRRRRGISRPQYLESANSVLCACAKCGSTTLLTYVYEEIFQSKVPDGLTSKFHELTIDEWKGIWTEAVNAHPVHPYRLAIIRDPKERLIAAWKSKVSCDPGTDPEGAVQVASLLEVWGREKDTSKTCLTMTEYLGVLQDIHADGNQAQLNNHFLPQDLGCFKTRPPSSWGDVSLLSAPGVFDKLASHIGTSNTEVPQKHHHKSHAPVQVTQDMVDVLNKVTSNEYFVLKDYILPESSEVYVGNEFALWY